MKSSNFGPQRVLYMSGTEVENMFLYCKTFELTDVSTERSSGSLSSKTLWRRLFISLLLCLCFFFTVGTLLRLNDGCTSSVRQKELQPLNVVVCSLRKLQADSTDSTKRSDHSRSDVSHISEQLHVMMNMNQAPRVSSRLIIGGGSRSDVTATEWLKKSVLAYN